MFQHVTAEFLVLGVCWYAVFLVAITLHEAAHAWAAHRLGDSTAYFAGQVTLHPLPHIEREPLGTVIVPIVSYLLGGWMFGWASAPYDPAWAGRYPFRAFLMALAGPASNLLLALLAALGLKLFLAFGDPEALQEALFLKPGQMPNGLIPRLYMLLGMVFWLNLVLCIFNLIPLPPLDGSAIWPLLLNPRQFAAYENFRRQPSFVIIGLIVAANLFSKIFPPVMFWILQLLFAS